MTDQERAVQRFKGQYLKSDTKPKEPVKGMESQRINLAYFGHCGKCPNRGGAQ